MHMIFTYMTHYYLYLHRLTYLSYQFSQSYPDILSNHPLAVFRYLHHMVLDIVYAMGGLSVVLHDTASLLKSSPKGEGFSPIPRMGH